MTTDDILEHLFDECREDHLGLCRIVNAVRLGVGIDNQAEIAC
jgi:hypothetical protein